MGQVKQDITHVKGDTFHRPNFAVFTHSRLSFESCLASFSLKKFNYSVAEIDITQEVSEDGSLIIGIDQIITLPVGSYDWDLEILFSSGEKYTYIGGVFNIIPESPTISRDTTQGINSYTITENNDTVSLTINDSPVLLPPKTGFYYALGWNNEEITWSAIATEGSGVTRVDIDSSTLGIVGSPITSDGTITINLSSEQIATILGYTPSSFDGIYSSLSGIPSEFVPSAHNQAISTITGLQTELDSKMESSDIANFETTTQLNSRDTANRDRTNHTGSQAISTITGLQTELDSKLESTDIANFETTTQLNNRDTANRDRTNHTGSQAISTITGLQTELDAKLEATDLSTLNTFKTNTENIWIDQKDPTGFDTAGDIISSYDSTTRTVTLSGTFKIYYKGTVILEVSESTWVSDPHSASPTTPLFLKYNQSGFSWGSAVWNFDEVMLCYVYYDSSSNFKFAIRETHGLMDWRSHKEFHETVGTYRNLGGGLLNYILASTTADNRRPNIEECTISDEDLVTVNSSFSKLTETYTLQYLSATNTVNFTENAVDIVPLSGNRPYYNQFTGGAWTQTLLGNNQYMCVWHVGVPATADNQSQKYRNIFVQGQFAGTLAEISARNPSSLNLSSLTNVFTEFVFLNKIIIQYSSSNWTIASVETITGTKSAVVTNSNNYLSIVTSDNSIQGDGTIASPLSLGTIRHYVVIASPVDKTYPIFPTIPYAITVQSVIIKTESGTCSATFKINASNITGLSSLSASSVVQTVSATANNVTVIGDTINLTVSASSSPVNLSIVIQYTIN